MSIEAPPAWFQRKFEFSFPLELLPNLCARLRGTPARLGSLFQDVPHHLRVAKQDQAWSAQEHAGHLLDLESLWLARVEDYLTGHPELTVADLTNRKTHEACHNSRALGTITSAFRIARQDLLTRIEALETAAFQKAIPHPRLNTPMRLMDHLFFVAEHDDHHLARMWQLVQ